jgi:prostatic aicd phosphatase
VNYAAAVALEIRQPSGSSEPVLRFQFKNGTDDAGFRTYDMQLPGMAAPGDVPLSTFLSVMEPAAVNTTLQWCQVCGQTSDRGCGALLAGANSSGSSSAPSVAAHHDKISPVGAGFLGAGLTAAVIGMLLAALVFTGFVSFGRRARKTSSSQRGLQSPVRCLAMLWLLPLTLPNLLGWLCPYH